MTTLRISIALLLCIIASLHAFAYDFICDGLAYNRNNDGTSCTLTRDGSAYAALSGSISIPATATDAGGNHYRVSAIADNAFSGNSTINAINIPESVSSIGSQAFTRATGLATITVADLNEHFASSNGILYDKARTTLIRMPQASRITSLTLPATVTTIADQAFAYCANIAAITLPQDLATIGDMAFTECYSLRQFSVNASNEHFSAQSGVLFNFDGSTLVAMPAGYPSTTYTVPSTVTHIAMYAFLDCNRLTGVTLPQSLAAVGYNAFGWCTSLTSIRCLADVPPTADNDAFYLVDTSTTNLYVPADAIYAYSQAPQWKAFSHILPLTTAIGDINGDGSINTSDVTALVALILSGDTTAVDNTIADINSDGSVNTSDITSIVTLILSAQ